MSQKLFVELDALLDTRLATIYQLNEPDVRKALANDWRNRTSDHPHDLGLEIDPDDFQSAYKNRDKSTLQVSTLTGAIPMLRNLFEYLKHQRENSPFGEYLDVEIAAGDYELDEEEKQAISEAVAIQTGAPVYFITTERNIESIDPKTLRENYAYVIVYHFDRWLHAHRDELEQTKIPRITFSAPKIYADRIPSEDEAEYDEQGQYVCPFASLEYILSEYLTLQILSAKYFSLIET